MFKVWKAIEAKKQQVYYYNPLNQAALESEETANALSDALKDVTNPIAKSSPSKSAEISKKNKFGFNAKRMKTQEVPKKSVNLDKSEEELKSIITECSQKLETVTKSMDEKQVHKNNEIMKLVGYYGEKTQTLLMEMHKENPTDPMSGEPLSLKQMIESIKISKELLQWDDEEEDFKPFI